MPAIDHLARDGIDHAEAIRRLVCRRAFRLHARRHPRRSAQGDENPLSVLGGMNPPRPLADWKCRDNGIGRSVDHRHIIRALVGDVDLVVLRFSAGWECRQEQDTRKNHSMAMPHVGMFTSCLVAEQGALKVVIPSRADGEGPHKSRITSRKSAFAMARTPHTVENAARGSLSDSLTATVRSLAVCAARDDSARATSKLPANLKGEEPRRADRDKSVG